MKKIIIVILFALIGVNQVKAQETTVIEKWTHNTSQLVPAGKWECGIFQPLRYGVSENIEISTHVLLFPLMPNVAFKFRWKSREGIILSSEHKFSYNSPFLNFFSRKGTGGLLSPEFDFPFILTLNNSFQASKPIGSNYMATLRLGYIFALHGTAPDALSTMDIPLFYPRMAQYYEGSVINPFAGFKAALNERWLCEINAQVFWVTRSENNFFFEHNGTIMRAFGKSLRLRGGYVLAYGKYPYGSPKWQMWPTLDIIFGSKK
jgi:hypothetical protein